MNEVMDLSLVSEILLSDREEKYLFEFFYFYIFSN